MDIIRPLISSHVPVSFVNNNRPRRLRRCKLSRPGKALKHAKHIAWKKWVIQPCPENKLKYNMASRQFSRYLRHQISVYEDGILSKSPNQFFTFVHNNLHVANNYLTISAADGSVISDGSALCKVFLQCFHLIFSGRNLYAQVLRQSQSLARIYSVI